eukprot:CAMPEP_0114687930 /NCGR_PEP_ID=MMETSP0191-20121206/62988_1 /TAXON_ID=126664 /ORGANISM="Sorites sp." /LENGTH=45 /DNA_ID= /DNA_START= /DNA_END= /DNA_ORIENTATION=
MAIHSSCDGSQVPNSPRRRGRLPPPDSLRPCRGSPEALNFEELSA